MSQFPTMYSSDLYSCLLTPHHALIRGNPLIKGLKTALFSSIRSIMILLLLSLLFTSRESQGRKTFAGLPSACCAVTGGG